MQHTLKSQIRVHLDRPIGDVHPHIYGHFIEHLAECIYNGMWAELIRNRKFAGHDGRYYGIVDPWQPVGGEPLRVYPGAFKGDDEGFHRDDPVSYAHDNTVYFVSGQSGRGQSQRIDLRRTNGGSNAYGIGQDGIGVRAGMRYMGRVVLRAEGLRSVDVCLAGEVQRISGIDDRWRSFNVVFTPQMSTDNAHFSIVSREEGRLWIGLASLMPDDNERGWRRDVNDLIRALRPPIIRYPGGNFASGYHWRDGVGDRDHRPVRFDRAWNVFEPNDVGTDEFLEFCHLVNADPYLCVNTGDGTPEEAAAWVEYCNGPITSPYGALRAQNGHPEPYNVIYWGIGNETYGNWQIGHVDAETYARDFVRWARAMRAADPDGKRLRLLAVGATPDRWPDWNAAVARIAGEEMDYITLHHYARADEKTPLEDEYLMTVTAPSRIADLIVASREEIDKHAPDGKQIPISVDEWNVIHRRTGADHPRQNYALADGLYAAGFFNVMLRNSNHIKMANQAQLVNLLGLIETSQTDAYATAEYLAFKLYIDHSGPVSLKVENLSPTFRVPAMGNMPGRRAEPYLDVAATADRDGRRLWVHVVNRHPREAMLATVELVGGRAGKAIAHVLTGPDPWARNTFANKQNIHISSSLVEIDPSTGWSFPACSATSLEIQVD